MEPPRQFKGPWVCHKCGQHCDEPVCNGRRNNRVCGNPFSWDDDPYNSTKHGNFEPRYTQVRKQAKRPVQGRWICSKCDRLNDSVRRCRGAWLQPKCGKYFDWNDELVDNEAEGKNVRQTLPGDRPTGGPGPRPLLPEGNWVCVGCKHINPWNSQECGGRKAGYLPCRRCFTRRSVIHDPSKYGTGQYAIDHDETLSSVGSPPTSIDPEVQSDQCRSSSLEEFEPTHVKPSEISQSRPSSPPLGSSSPQPPRQSPSPERSTLFLSCGIKKSIESAVPSDLVELSSLAELATAHVDRPETSQSMPSSPSLNPSSRQRARRSPSLSFSPQTSSLTVDRGSSLSQGFKRSLSQPSSLSSLRADSRGRKRLRTHSPKRLPVEPHVNNIQALSL